MGASGAQLELHLMKLGQVLVLTELVRGLWVGHPARSASVVKTRDGDGSSCRTVPLRAWPSRSRVSAASRSSVILIASLSESG